MRVDPPIDEVRSSLSTFNRTTVLKKCYNQTCIDEFRQKIHNLIDLELFRKKRPNYAFYVTSNKSEGAKLSPIFEELPKSSNKQEIYLRRNDLLGTEDQLYSAWLE